MDRDADRSADPDRHTDGDAHRRADQHPHEHTDGDAHQRADQHPHEHTDGDAHQRVGVAEVARRLEAAGYLADDATAQAVASLFTIQGSGTRALLIFGPPGCGKTALGEALARVLGAELVFCQLHRWTSADELYRGVDVAAAVGGDAARVYEPGVLARAAAASLRGLVLLVLDELDKAGEEVEGLLLDFLQTGRVPTRPGEHIVARREALLVVLTSNETRPHTEALMRRARRLRMKGLDEARAVRLVTARAKISAAVATALWRAAVATAEAESTTTSVQEVVNLAAELPLCRDFSGLLEAARGWLPRTAEGVAMIDTPRVRKHLGAAWAEWVRATRR